MANTLRQESLGRARRIVIKLGTGLLTDRDNRLALPQIESLVGQVAALFRNKRQVLLVSSGAIGAGMAELGLKQRPKKLDELQAAAAIGQSKLMALYDRLFANFDITVAQVLLTHDDLRNRARHLNAHNTLTTLIARNIIPVINENDTVSVDEIKFGDNDLLAALTAMLMDADLLVILSHVEGLLNQGVAVSIVPQITRDIERLAGGTDRVTSVGGMKSKIEAAKIVTRAGISMVIAHGERKNVLAELTAGADVGTWFVPQENKLASRKRWIAFFQRPVAAVIVDEGAVRAVRENQKSLLAKGVASAAGQFKKGDVVSIRDKNLVEFARGLTKVSSTDLNTATGVVVHRDDLVVL